MAQPESFDILLSERERLAGRHPYHQLDEIEPGHQLGYRVLDLEPRVHFEKIEIALLVDDELDRAGRAVIDGSRQRDRLPAHRFAGFGVEKRARRLLDDLLVAALDRAFALAEIDDVAVGVAEHLDLDMPRLFDVFLDKDAVVGKARFRLARGRAKTVARLGVVRGDPHPLAAAAGGSLDHDRIADVAGDRDGGIGIGNDVEVAGHARYPGGARQLFRLDLVAHRGDRLRRRADEGHSGLRKRPGKSRVFRQKPVAGVDRLGAALPACLDDPLDIEVALGRGRRPDADRFVGHPHMQSFCVGIGIDRHRRDPHPMRGADNAAGDLAAIGNQDLAEHEVRAAARDCFVIPRE